MNITLGDSDGKNSEKDAPIATKLAISNENDDETFKKNILDKLKQKKEFVSIQETNEESSLTSRQ